VNCVGTTPQDAHLLVCIRMFISSDNVTNRSIVTCRDIGIVAMIEAGYCPTQVMGCIKGRTSINLIVASARCMTEDGCLGAASASLACFVRERMNHVSSYSGERKMKPAKAAAEWPLGKLSRIINSVLVTRANGTVIHDLPQPISYLDAVIGDYWPVDCPEVRAKATNKPFEEDLEDCSCDQGVEQTDGGVFDAPEGTCRVGVTVVAFK
jgi:hypothetical protein